MKGASEGLGNVRRGSLVGENPLQKQKTMKTNAGDGMKKKMGDFFKKKYLDMFADQ